VVLFDGNSYSGKIWDITTELVVFEDEEGNYHNLGPLDVKEVFLLSGDQYLLDKINKYAKEGRKDSRSKGIRDAKKKHGFQVLHFGLGFLFAQTGIISLSPIQTDQQIRMEIPDWESMDKGYQIGYIEKARRKNRKALRLGFISGILTQIISSGGGPIRF
jgi:hypothetical protein